ncbi:Protein-S-isoprenylcysteine O-methyltransferase Ste14 [Evansella caseinilytica]|uniref:Protein-S-isoprenylcysteine O-methyltransferase Ste14 n=1 Tax=Evansella caseinilytica TaxID=1503961 RepID=A0A1H3UR75_9BACI|nr:isoprenylcysteine carboxylmethyltransferase family protein [Evansella caseinilytica]SDZ64269.1 Protein-S-isoprenylcysteine O-methyltransferase Ste14 [Evansella caseinilytica]
MIIAIVFYVLLAAWLMEWVVFKETATIGKGGKRKTFYIRVLLGVMFLCAVVSSFMIAKVSGKTYLAVKVTGLLILALGLFLRYWTYRFTKPHFTRTIIPLENRPLYSNGPYRFTRHPFHTGFFLNSLGGCLFISGHWLAVLVTFIFVGTALHYRMAMEESLYSEKYGDIYVYWCRHRFRLLPFLY